MKANFLLNGFYRDKKGRCWKLLGLFHGFLNPQDGSYTIKVPVADEGNGKSGEEVITIKEDSCYGRKA